MRAFYLAIAGGGGPVNLVLLGPTISGFVELSCAASSASGNAREFCRRVLQMRYRAPSVASVFVPSLVTVGSLAALRLRKVCALARLFAMVGARAHCRFGLQRRGSLGAGGRRCAWLGFDGTLRGYASRLPR